jgi:hypothetical protein
MQSRELSLLDRPATRCESGLLHPCTQGPKSVGLRMVLAVGLGTFWIGAVYADSTHIHAVNTSCRAFTDYVSANQSILEADIGGAPEPGINDLEGITTWDFHVGKAPLTFTVRSIHKSERFHCRCSGRDVENYERDCPVGLKCFGDFMCPPGQDCENHPCVSGDIAKLPITRNSVDISLFHWSPQNETAQCAIARNHFNAAADAHEMGHAQQYRQDINNWIASHPPSSFHRYECGADVAAIEGKIADEIQWDLQNAIDLLTLKLTLDTEEFHQEKGATIPPPDCSCGER